YSSGMPRVIGVIEGSVQVVHPEQSVTLHPGEFCLLPAALSIAKLESAAATKFLSATPGV
ncbi:MAG TPA: hypothetical protein VGR78_15640, partial [Verrucomicrobiae bacterium]|nr:hypothetical protein [Verrucomicrobiae bacterium]